MNNEQKEPIEQVEEEEQAEQKAETEQSKDNNKKEKKSIKEFFKELFNDLKLKPTTLENARKRTFALCKLLGIGGGILSIILMIMAPGVGITLAIACAILIGGLCLKMWIKTERNFCSKCKEKFNYDTDVNWMVTQQREEGRQPGSSNIIKKRYATIKFTCTCSKCHNLYEFTEEKEIVTWYSDGKITEKNVADIARSYFQL